MIADTIIRGIKTLYTSVETPPVKGHNMAKVQAIEAAFIAIKDGKIMDLGNHDDGLYQGKNTRVFHANGLIALPGFVDGHTHLVHGGSREKEFALKLKGVPYLEILKNGGGILNTVKATREASFEELYDQARESLDEMLLFGVTTIEAKSGYGLDLETEIKQLEVIKALASTHSVRIVPTYMGAHAIPEEYRQKKSAYIDKIKADLSVISKKKLALYVDVFCEEGVFSLEETEEMLDWAIQLGFIPRLHADEIKPMGGAGLGVKLKAASVDHLVAIGQSDLKMVAESDTVANLLPATSFFLNHDYAPARELIKAGAAVAIASDYNPGSTPSENFQLTMQLAGNKLQMTPSEILTAATINPAYHLGLAKEIGSLEVGKAADIVLMKANNLDYLIYHYGINHTRHVFKNGIAVVINRQIKGKGSVDPWASLT
ncbi:MAG: imidazolonepropionase [Candidatus Izemoplasmatales bacterium]|jgi:imidazolonepropionase|nr:imidazolonepropionase [Candidatus Izemoplasmatales bacterium]MDD4355168.1 imidazolonepropionase [Candidatus Izemoplasmatales bacterium]MDD4988082.1 imidazolonepropionase [Candidatus Izemoplasmatales bacterium]MDY0373277.1 imidazolonepropionase [Candidatus Izemoplasmatales bacterium]